LIKLSQKAANFMSDDLEKEQVVQSVTKVPSLWQNYITLFGGVIAAASIVSIVLLFLIEMTSTTEHSYLGILIYILLPGMMMFGFGVMVLGIVIEWRRRRKLSTEEIAAYPILDLSGPRRRRLFFTFLSVAFVFIMISAFGSYRAYEYTESVPFCGELCHVMKPENTAYKASAHARVKCVECHVGGGADHYLKSKFAGVRQVIALFMNSYQTPIPTPVDSLRPAQDICERCHWPEKFFGEQMKIFTHYGFDEKNTMTQARLLIKTGGGSPITGQGGGIHWHMNVANEVTYIATDEKRQKIAWVRFKNANGDAVDYYNKNSRLTPELIESAPKRRMDCVDCHNRPAHVYLSPNQAVDQSLAAGRLDVSLPFMKLKAVDVLSRPYNTTDEALATIAREIPDYYKTGYPDINSSKPEAIAAAVTEIQRLYSTYFFPEMRTDWQSHTNNIGHLNFQGCFRCHDGNHVSKEGKVIRTECHICHVTLDQTVGGKTFQPANGDFEHPIDRGDKGRYQCAQCHTGNRGFEHPVKLGDISKFECAECHKAKVE
jgi:nitrate/TMAO reductase-like tetraheme cytochrome c subunit